MCAHISAGIGIKGERESIGVMVFVQIVHKRFVSIRYEISSFVGT